MKKRAPKTLRFKPRPPLDVPREFFTMFGRVEQDLAVAVEAEVQRRCYDAPRRSRELVDVVLLDIGAREGNGFGLRYGYTLLKAGRFLLSTRRHT